MGMWRQTTLLLSTQQRQKGRGKKAGLRAAMLLLWRRPLLGKTALWDNDDDPPRPSAAGAARHAEPAL